MTVRQSSSLSRSTGHHRSSSSGLAAGTGVQIDPHCEEDQQQYSRSSSPFSTSATAAKETPNSLVLRLLQTTTHAIRTVQRYFLSLPPDRLPSDGIDSAAAAPYSVTNRTVSGSRHLHPSLGVITAARPIPRYSSKPTTASQPYAVGTTRPSLSETDSSSSPSESAGVSVQDQDPLTRLRNASLATLEALREMEVNYRIPGSITDGPRDSEDAILHRGVSDLSLTVGESGGPPSLSYTEDDASDLNSSDAATGGRTGEEASAAASETSMHGHLYQEDVSLRDLAKEAEIVQRWVETVDSLLTMMNHRRARQRTQSNNLASSSGPRTPRWAREEEFPQDNLGEWKQTHTHALSLRRCSLVFPVLALSHRQPTYPGLTPTIRRVSL